MTTTDEAGRRGGVRARPATGARSRPQAQPGGEDTTLENTLESARRVLADVTAFLEREIDRLLAAMTEGEPLAPAVEPGTADRLKTLHDLIKQNQAALRTVLEMRARLGRPVEAERTALLDLEAARAEILDRVARLAPGD